MSTRRDFIKVAAANALGVALCRGDGVPENGGMAAALRELLVAAGYDPTRGNGAVLAVISDAHIFLGTEYPTYRTEQYDDNLIAEINSLDPLVTDLVMAGDLISYHTMSPGIPAYPIHLVWAKEEYALAKAQMARYKLKTWMVPGNHDAAAYETDAELFREQMQVPAYQKTVLGGVPVLFLNSGSAGMLDAVQYEWFKSEAVLVPANQEVLIVVHYPVFFLRWAQAGVKRMVTDVFKNHRATVWVMSGHNHSYAEGKLELDGVTYVQTLVTSATTLPGSFGDRRNPGYAVLALQDGRMICRLFRSLKDSGYSLRPAIAEMAADPVLFLFDEITQPLAQYEEGFYDRTNRVLGFSGVDVGCYITYCKNITFRVDPADYMGSLSQFAVTGAITALTRPACSVSFSGEEGTWVPVEFPPAMGSGLYRVVIPEEFRNRGVFFLKLDTGLTDLVDGFNLSGWALLSNAEELAEYEKWTYQKYGSLQRTAASHPNAITPGSAESNLINFAFNLMPRQDGEISGFPKQKIPEAAEAKTDSRLVFARMAARLNSGITYQLERSVDLVNWQPVLVGGCEETVLRSEGNWEEVECLIYGGSEPDRFHRIQVTTALAWAR